MKTYRHRIPLTIIFLIYFSASLNAQDFGVRTGTSFSFFYKNGRMNAARPGWIIGAFFDQPVSEVFGVSAGVDYHQMSASLPGKSETIDSPPAVNELYTTQHSFTFYTIESQGMFSAGLPVAALGDLKLKLCAGASVAYNISTWDNYETYFLPESNGHQHSDELVILRGRNNVRSSSRQLNPSWLVGMQIGIPLQTGVFKKFSFDIRLRNSLVAPIYTLPYDGSADDPMLKSIITTIGFTF